MPLNQDCSNFDALTQIVATLRAPGGCPWDRKQTHQTLGKHLVEECYEALEAFDEDDPAKIKEELGDILLQVMLHSRIAEDKGLFSVDDVISVLSDKLVSRHPTSSETTTQPPPRTSRPAGRSASAGRRAASPSWTESPAPSPPSPTASPSTAGPPTPVLTGTT